ncbi:MAG: hypothetical protein LBQ04_01450 [Endomicrobium sp.]|jgi:cell filamentation protein|nr:hypothetical protein [Endomicrobium sp.]
MSKLDELSKKNVYQLFDSGDIAHIKIGTVKELCQIHKYLFEGLYAFVGNPQTKYIKRYI